MTTTRPDKGSQPPLSRLMAEQALARSAGAPLVAGNAVELLFDASENFPRWLAAVENARESILIEMYLFADDELGRQFRDLLCRKAQQGVAVYLLYDWLGCWKEHLWRFFAPLKAAGAHVRSWQAPGLGSGLRLLGRDHRKLIVIDGATAFIGGLCISSHWADWRDTGLQLRGPLLADCLAAFADSWQHTGTVLPPDIQPVKTEAGNVAARLIATTPATANLMRLDLLIAGFARQRLWLTDAYFMGTGAYLAALQQAARDGVDVRLLVPRSSDIPWIATVSRTLYRPLLEAGVRVFEWNGPMIHAKTAVADGRWARIGSTNLNWSSWMANRELDLAIEDDTLAAQMEQRFLLDLEHATEVVLGGRRGQPLLKERRRAKRLPVRQQAAAGAAAAARQAVRIGEVVEAAVRGTRAVEHSEASAFLAIALVLLGAAVLLFFFPQLAAIPLMLLLGIAGGAVLLRSLGLYHRRYQQKRNTPSAPQKNEKADHS